MAHKDKPLEGRFTFLIDRERGTSVEIRDSSSGTVMLRLQVTPEETLAMLSRQAEVKCSFTTAGLDRIGKKMEMKTLHFKMPSKFSDSYDKIIARENAERECPEGWIPDLYFNSQNSFYTEDEQHMAQCTIRRWI